MEDRDFPVVKEVAAELREMTRGAEEGAASSASVRWQGRLQVHPKTQAALRARAATRHLAEGRMEAGLVPTPQPGWGAVLSHLGLQL